MDFKDFVALKCDFFYKEKNIITKVSTKHKDWQKKCLKWHFFT